ncbi:MAG: UDP-N-acetylmuramoyl-L-alanine--D-glutamate ligase [Anaerolineales bacterium]|nr:MAG: UDP-N-acetylmuramoyl-L-alanine--D-glutamate ligase [Anaerolineales bacterium]
MDFRRQRATVIGLAREGTALARFLAEGGATVTVSDIKSREELSEGIEALVGLPIRFVLGGHPTEILEADVVFVSPGVPLEIPILAEARKRGIPISSETRLFAQLCLASIVGITGSSGKTTTTALVGEMLKKAGYRTWVGGNIGQPLIGHLTDIRLKDKVVMELSSFQLEFFAPWPGKPAVGAEDLAFAFTDQGWSPPIAAILNITPNHLDRHPTMEAYIEAKVNILRYQGLGDVAVMGYDNPVTANLESRISNRKSRRVLSFSLRTEVEQGAFVRACPEPCPERNRRRSRRDGKVVLRLGEEEWQICAVADIKLLGQHNVENVLAACAIAGAAGADPQSMSQVVTTFTGLEHRLELVRTLRGVRYYNDSIATSPERTVAALHSFEEPIVLLAGGRDKHLPWEEMAQLTLRKVRHLVLFGEARPIIEKAIHDAQRTMRSAQLAIHRCSTLEEAVEIAAENAQPGDVVLLAPGGTSFDAFRDFAERGERFRELVEAL